MTPKPESETDPWAKVRALRPNPYNHENYYVASEVDAAIATEAAQHQQEIDIAHGALLGVEQAVLGFERAGDDPDGAIAMALITKQEATDLRARLAAVEAERDSARRQLADIAAGGDKAAKCVVEMAKELVAALTARNEAQAERDRLKAALERLRDCDWTIGRGDRMDAVRDIARAALTPQGQSADGETR